MHNWGLGYGSKNSIFVGRVGDWAGGGGGETKAELTTT